MNGFLLVNKPKDFTSHDVVNIVRKKLGTKKVGHTGTLDPLATGVLVLCVGAATKLVEYLTFADKEYEVTAQLGIKTTTDDITGEIVATSNNFEIEKVDLLATINDFVGDITQTPPIYSAIKVAGKKLYDYARAGKDVAIPKRNITIYSIKFLSKETFFNNTSNTFNRN